MWRGPQSAHHVVVSFHIHVAMLHVLERVSGRTWLLVTSAIVANARVDHGIDFCGGIVNQNTHVSVMSCHGVPQTSTWR